jgi:hypothetical protein
MRRTAKQRPARRRSGATLVHFAIVLPVLLAMIGLVLDGGILLATYRQVQNAADAAAAAAAMDKFRGADDATATATANTFMATNGMSGVTLTLNGGSSNALNIPPQDPGNTGSPFKNLPHYVEAVVTRQVNTFFIRAVGVSSNQITARAVAGYEPVGNGEGAIVLDPTASPGISVQGTNTLLTVNGTVVVNSNGKGVDQFGVNVTAPGGSQYAIQTQATPSIIAKYIQSVGGVDTLNNLRAYDPAFTPPYDPTNTDRPLIANSPVAPDPLQDLVTPKAGNGVVTTYPKYLGGGNWDNTSTSPQDVTIGNADTVRFSPGIYRSISITGGTVTFDPGIYVVGQGNTSGGGNRLNINGGTVNGTGVMFYNTGSDYNATTPPENSTGEVGSNSTPNAPSSTKFGPISINGGTGALTAINDPSSPFDKMLFYQRRWNTSAASIAGGGNLQLGDATNGGTIYAKWANFQLSGGGTFNAQFIVGTLSISGGATVTINATGKNFGKANEVYLVE